MSLGQVLIERELLTAEEVDRAVRRQKMAGGALADSIVALGFLTREDLEDVLGEPPRAPTRIEDTGLDHQFLLNYLFRVLYVFGVETIPDASDYTKLPTGIVSELFEESRKKRLLEPLGPSRHHPSILRYALSGAGRERATESMKQTKYTGPAPVTRHDYEVQVSKQSLTNERTTPEDLAAGFADLVLPREILDRLGPAVNSNKAVLLYGGSGNGKTSVAEAIGTAFKQTVYIPHAIEVDGQIIKVFDPSVHQPVETPEQGNGADGGTLFRDRAEVDPRWVLCRRPVVMTAGELNIEMLDLNFDPVSKYYEAPAHIKATGGVFIIDDFGRQRVSTNELLNRWILPLERRIDYLTLHTGMKLRLPFDELVVFSTNYPPEQLMDAAGLRRIQYKIFVPAPTRAEYAEIFRRVCEAHGLTPFPDVLSYLMDEFYPQTGVSPAGFHPKFIVEHVVARSNFEGVPPRLTKDRVKEAVRNLVVSESPPEF